jgi:FMN phosphatase YigB (HAD superfamily)
LLDAARMRQQYQQELATLLVLRYGGTVVQWIAADQQVVADWRSYHADLNFSGDDGLQDFYESLYRVTRALFRLAGIAEPPHEELLTLSRTLPIDASRTVQALYPDAEQALRALAAEGYRIGIASYIPQAQIEVMLESCGVRACFTAPLIGFDTLERYERDRHYFEGVLRLAQVEPACCLFVDDGSDALKGASEAGIRTVFLRRTQRSYPELYDHVLDGSLLPLVECLRNGCHHPAESDATRSRRGGHGE